MGPGLPLALVLLVLILGFVTARPANPALYPPTGQMVTVYVVSNGFHADIAMPADLLIDRPGPLAIAAASVERPWVTIGWGDASFYTGKGFSLARLADGARALFAPENPSLIRVQGLGAHPARAFSRSTITPIELSAGGFEALTARMEASFKVRQGAPLPMVTPTRPGEAFFHSTEHFSILRTCSHWTADALNAGGLPVTPMADVIATGLLIDLRLRAGVHALDTRLPEG